jgi:hypothetical protein
VVGGGGYGGYREGSFRMRERDMKERKKERKNVYLSFFTLYNKFTAAASKKQNPCTNISVFSG